MAEEEVTRGKTTSTSNKKTTKKTTAKKTTAKKSTAKKTTAKKSTAAKKTAAEKKTTNKKTTNKKTTTQKKSTTAKSSSRSVSLTTDLKKFADETYETTELMRGVLLIIGSEGSEALRSIVLAFLSSKVPLIGEQLSAQARTSFIRKLNDDYKKLNADDRKAMRSVLSWLQGDYQVDERTTSQLVSLLNQPPGATTPPATNLPPAASGPSLQSIAQGFVLPPQT
jgi:DNA mismatch repair ATPase MutL